MRRYAMSVLLFLTGCAELSGGSDPTCPPAWAWDGEACAFDEPSLLALVGDMDGGQLVRINTEPYLPPYSATPIRRNVWVSPLPLADDPLTDAVALYTSIDQDDAWTPLADELPVGTVIIHEAVDREEPHGVAVKRDDYVNDWGTGWWFQMITDDGTYDTEGREPCGDCHTEWTRASEGLWGVPADAKPVD